MDKLSLTESTDTVLGREFLTWLWYRSDTTPGAFTDKNGAPFSVSMEQRIVVQAGEGESRETASVSGSFSPLREARFGLGTGKKMSRALLRLEKDELAFQLTMKAEDFSLAGLKTPKQDKNDREEDPDAFLLKKFYLLGICVDLLDSLYKRFLKLRLSADWQNEVSHIGHWLTRLD
ncbi:hypothetical protein AGMMS49925_08980 [Deltaproteobacteria bacterium]|nr:hypothetical protein AGMMS49925_08980 [Deltaproteobacteria bacterium]